jgi:hypothetical protein
VTDDQIAKLFAPASGARPAPVAVQPVMRALLCTGCVLDAKRAVLAGTAPADIPEPLPAAVLIQGMGLCDVRHTLDVQPPSLLIAQPGQMPGGLG